MTNETTPRHIWKHEVQLSAIRAGVPADYIQEFHAARLTIWYNAGETMDGAVTMLRQFWTLSRPAARAEREAAGMKKLTGWAI